MTLYHTPGSNLVWRDFTDWGAALVIIERRRYSASKETARTHLIALPLDLIHATHDRAALRPAIDFLTGPDQRFARPGRGRRANAPHTPILVALSNRLAVLERSSI